MRLVEIAGRLVGQQQRRLHHQRPRNRDALLLAAGQLARPMLQTFGQSDPSQEIRGAAARFFTGRRAMRIGISTFSAASNSGSR